MAVFPLVPDRVEEITPEFKTNIVKFESGAEQRSPNMSGNKTTFRLSWNVVSRTGEVADLLTFFNTCKGAYASFTFTNPHGSATYTCRFKDDKIRYVPINNNYGNVSVEIIEC